MNCSMVFQFRKWALWDIEHPVRKGEEPHVTADMLKRFIPPKDSVEDGKNMPRLLGEGDLRWARPCGHEGYRLRRLGMPRNRKTLAPRPPQARRTLRNSSNGWISIEWLENERHRPIVGQRHFHIRRELTRRCWNLQLPHRFHQLIKQFPPHLRRGRLLK